MKNIHCRFYEKELPDPDSFVMVEITEVGDNGANCRLLEYNGITGFMPTSEFSRRRVRSIRQVAKEGNQEILQVLKVDPRTKNIDLSKKHLTQPDIETATNRFRKHLKAHKIMSTVSMVSSVPIANIYRDVIWLIEKDDPMKFLESSCLDQSLWDQFKVTPNLKTNLIETVQKRVTLKAIRFETEVNIWSLSPVGVNNLRNLFESVEKSLKALDVTLVIKTPPVYVLSTQSISKADGESKLQKAIDIIKSHTIENSCEIEVVI